MINHAIQVDDRNNNSKNALPTAAYYNDGDNNCVGLQLDYGE